LLYFGWGYGRLLRVGALPLSDRVTLLVRFLRVDWHVLHAHRPSEIVSVCEALAARGARPGEVMVEAGCWNGGSSAKFSLICKLGGYGLHIYDSFEGVEPLGTAETRQGHDFSGEYAAPETVLHDSLRRFGDPSVCTVYKGWFRTTLAREPVADPVRLVFIDCDSAKGTEEVLEGMAPRLTADGVIFSQDYHLASVRQLLCEARTWQRLGLLAPTITRLGGHLARLCPARA
jgi:O-methyltransferase